MEIDPRTTIYVLNEGFDLETLDWPIEGRINKDMRKYGKGGIIYNNGVVEINEENNMLTVDGETKYAIIESTTDEYFTVIKARNIPVKDTGLEGYVKIVKDISTLSGMGEIDEDEALGLQFGLIADYARKNGWN
ncbi:MAG: hypothetical protein KAT28_05140 [Candidatus Aenigmarchaeota archaeon]|nr:hypothetical protein [Candidatus Aenigmarchaeota archaeon]